MTRNCGYSYHHKCKSYDMNEMGNILIEAMKESDLEIVCDRLVLIKESCPKDTKRQILSDKLIQELKSSEGNAVFKELLIEIKADDLQYVCTSLVLLKSTSSMRKPIKDDLLLLLKAHINFRNKSGSQNDAEKYRNSSHLKNNNGHNGDWVGLRCRFACEPFNMDLLKVEFGEYGGINGMWMDQKDWIVYIMVSSNSFYKVVY